MADVEAWMRRAVALAAEARAAGDHPFGAVLVDGDAVLLEARNTVISERDATRHAELNLVSQASRELTPEVLARTVLVTSTEPCAMCCGALYWAGVRRVVYGLPAAVLEVMAGGGLGAPSHRVLGDASEAVELRGPVLEAEARVVHEGFWG